MADEPELLDLYREMVTIRRFEEKASELYSAGKIAGAGNLYPGEEAVAVGAMAALADQDHIVSTYRQYGHCIAKGTEPRLVMAELFGKETGLSGGRGGPAHLFDPERRFNSADGSAGGLPLAVGLGFSVAYEEKQEVVGCLFGDDALARGTFHESMNMAALWNLPVIFVCENNFYGMGTMAPNAVAQEHLYKFAEPYQIPGVRVDGDGSARSPSRGERGGGTSARGRRPLADRCCELSFSRPFNVGSRRLSLEARRAHLGGARSDQEPPQEVTD